MQRTEPTFFPDESPDQTTLFEADKPPSLLNGVIPRFVQRRLPPLRSVRNLASSFIRPPLHARSSSASSSGSSSSSRSPPPPYTSEPSSDSDDDMDADFESAHSSRPSTADSSSSALARTPSHLTPPSSSAQTADSLIRFKFANHGLMLVAQSAQEHRSSIHTTDEYSRRLYLDGIAYLMRGLPADLSEEERTNLRASLPEPIRYEISAPNDGTSQPGMRMITGAQPHKQPRRSLLHNVVSAVVFWTLLILATILPYARFFAQQAYAFERRHKLSELCLNQSLAATQIFYNRLLAVVAAIWAVNDGMVGRAIADVGVWCAQNVSEGVRDGLADAVTAMRQNRD